MKNLLRSWVTVVAGLLTVAAAQHVSMVYDIYPGSTTSGTYIYPNSSSPYNLTVFNNNLYFSANDGSNGYELWVYDPSLATGSTNPRMVQNIYPGSSGSSPYNFIVFNTKLYFTANDGSSGRELWVYDGTTASLVADIYPGTSGSSPSNFTVFNNKLYFQANDATSGGELWVYDGTTASLAADIYPGTSGTYPYGSYPSNLTVFDNKLYFQANDGTNGSELWVYDGTTASLAADIYPGTSDTYNYPNSSSPYYLTVFNSKLYFTANDGTSGSELWVYDGTTASLAADIYPGSTNNYPNGSYPYYLTVFNSQLYFTANDGTSGGELWVYDGTTASLVVDIYPGTSGTYPNGSWPSWLTIFNDRLYFQANNGVKGGELWVYDGSNPPALAADIYSGTDGSSPSYLTVFQDKLYFTANDGINGGELWVYSDPPNAPTGLTAEGGNQQVTLRWNRSLDPDVNKYRIYRDTTALVQTFFHEIVSATSPDTFYVNAGLINGQIYFYRVTAVDVLGSESVMSNRVNRVPNAEGHQIVELLADSTSFYTTGETPGYPLNTYYHDMQHQSIYLAGDLSSVGIPSGSYIIGLEIKPSASPGRDLEDFRIATQFTTVSELTTFETQLTNNVVYGPVTHLAGDFTPGKWYRFPAATSTWNGTDNLIVEFSHDNEEWLAGGGVYLRQAGAQRAYYGYDDEKSYPFTGTNALANLYQYDKVVALRLVYSNVAPPAIPTGFIATPGNGQVTLSWTSITGAVKYRIYRSTVSGFAPSTNNRVAEVTAGTSYTDSQNIVNNTAYYYRITSVNSAGLESQPSGEQSATPSAPPPAPTNLSAFGGNSTVDLTWVGNPEAVKYRLYRRTDATATPAITDTIITIFSNGYSDTSAVNGTTYHYWVTALNAYQVESAFSASVSATPTASLTTHNGPDWWVNPGTGKDENQIYSGSRVNPFKSLSHALSFNQLGGTAGVTDTIKIISTAADTIRGPLNRGITGTYNGVDFVLLGVNGPENTIIDADGLGKHLELSNYTAATQIIGITFLGGKATGFDEGGSISLGSNTSLIFKDCIFKNNQAISTENQSKGGAVRINSDSPSNTVKFIRCKFINNTVTSIHDAYGGAVFSRGNSEYENCLFVGNKAVSGEGQSANIGQRAFGAGVMVDGGGAEVKFTHCTFVNNTVENKTNSGQARGAAVSNLDWENGQKIYIYNSIIWGSKAIGETDAENKGDWSIYRANTQNFVYADYDNIDYTSSSWLDVHTYSVPPGFKDPGAGDFSLSDASPLLGKGSSSFGSNPSDDLTGASRPQPSTSAPDMGAYENTLGTTSAPMPVVGLTGQPKTYSALLSWEANVVGPGSNTLATDIARYVVYQQNVQAGYDSVASTTQTSITIRGLSHGTSYTFKVRAVRKVDTAEYYGGYSDEVTVVPKFTGPRWYVANAEGGGKSSNEGSDKSPYLYFDTARDAAAAGDTIVFLKGIHTGPRNRNLNLTNSKQLVVMGDPNHPPEETILDAGGNGRHFIFESGEDTSYQVIGLTLTNGTGIDVQYGNTDDGGSVKILNGSSPVFRKVIFKSNTTAINARGGAVYANGSHPRFYDCRFTGNQAASAEDNWVGGGAVYTEYGWGSNLPDKENPVKFIRCLFDKNEVVVTGANGTAQGGGLWIGAHAELINCVIVNNRAVSAGNAEGGGLYLVPEAYDINRPDGENPVGGIIKVINCTIARNRIVLTQASSWGDGGGITARGPDDGTLVMINTIIWENRILGQPGRTEANIAKHSNVRFDFDYNDTEEKEQYPWIGDNSLGIYPEFADTAGGRFNLSDASFLIGAGIDTLDIHVAPPDDFNKNPRPNPAGSMPDIGAFENVLGKSPYPRPVKDLVYTPLSESIELSWKANPSEDSVSVYRVYIGSSRNFVPSIDDTAGTTADTSFTVTGLANGITYFFKVTAVNRHNYQSGFSPEVVAVPQYLGPVWWVSLDGHDEQNDGSKAKPLASLKAAYEKVTAGQDTIVVKPGTYLLSGGPEDRTIDKNVVLVALEGPDSTTLDANFAGNHFTLRYPVDKGFVLKGFTLRNGWDQNGGSLRIEGASPRIIDCRFVGNSAWNSGGAIQIFNGGPVFVDCVFDSNRVNSEDGGGQGGAVEISIDPFQPGALDSVQFIRSSFRENEVSALHSAMGGAVYVQKATRFVNCLIADNRAIGGVNSGDWQWSQGGGVYTQTTYWDGSQDVSAGRTEFINTTIASNRAVHSNTQGAGEGGALFIENQNEIVVFNTLVVGNQATDPSSQAIWDNGSTLEADFNYFQTGVNDNRWFRPNTYRDFPPGLTDPLGKDYSLADHSPLRDKGTSEPFAGIKPPSRDIRRYPRIGESSDIGAYEAGVPRIFIALPQGKQRAALDTTIADTLVARDPFGNIVADYTAVKWNIIPDRGFISIDSAGTDTVTINGRAVYTLKVTSDPAAKTFEFRILADVDGVRNTTGIYYVDSEFTGTIPSPESVSIEPPDWTVDNNFSVNWTNPVWEKPFVGAFLIIEQAQDKFYAGNNLQLVENIELPRQGVVDVKIYLVDDFGRSDSNSIGMVQARWDQTPPQGFNINDPPPDAWESPTPYFEWEPSSDTHSGIERYEMIIDDSRSYPVPGGQNFFDLSENAPLSDGDHQWWVVAVDSAGNATESYEKRILRVDTTPPNVSHTPITEVDEGNSINISWNAIDDGAGVSRAELYYRRSGEEQWNSSDLFTNPNIPGNFVMQWGVDYYLEVDDQIGNLAHLPPDNDYFSVQVRLSNIHASERYDWGAGIPSGRDVTDYQFFSIPYDVGNARPYIDAAFGDYDKTRWRFFGYDGDWVEYPDLNRVETGEAYFLLNGEEDPQEDWWGNLEFWEGGKTNPTDQPWEVDLSPGQWTFIGNPFGFTLTLNEVYTDPADPEGSTLAGDNNFRTWQSGSGQWPTVGAMDPWNGYIYKSTSASRLYIDPRGIGGGSKVLAGEAPLEEGEWLVDITASSGHLQDELNQVGMRHAARDQYDPLDAFQPPLPPGGIALLIDNRGWEENGDIYATDIRSVSEAGHFWDLEVVAPPLENSAYLDFTGVAEIPAEFDVFVVDKTIGQAQNLRWDPSYHYVKTAGNQKLRFLVGTREFLKKNNAGVQLYPEAYSLSQNFPNPFNPQTTITLALEDNAVVDLVVYNLLGQEVARLARQETRPAGYYQFIWKGTDRQGRRVASGVYFYSARVRTAAGKQVFNRTRKMLLVK